MVQELVEQLMPYQEHKLVEQEYISSGIYNYTWDGEGRSTGIYFITLQAQIGQDPTVIFSRKMIYLK